MAIYKMVGDKERLDKVAPSSFGQEGVLERSDLQRLLREQPEVLEEDLFIITEEFSNWEGSGRSIDLLGLDATGRLVVVELKRGETGEHADLQAIRYAAMISTMTLQQAIDAHRQYLNKRNRDGDAEVEIARHLEKNEGARFASEKPRIILASEGFSSELTTCALWLNETGLDVTCVRVQPHRSGSELLIETSQIIPLPEAQNYLVRVREREEEQGKERDSIMGNFVPGGRTFSDRINSVEESVRETATRLYEWAVALEQYELAVLSTYIHNERCNLLVGLPTGNNPCPIRVYMADSVIRFRPDYFTAYAPKSVSRLEALIGRGIEGHNHSFGVPFDKINEEILAILTQAYREANGRPADDAPEPAISENSSAQS